jgi:hypothetical protein
MCEEGEDKNVKIDVLNPENAIDILVTGQGCPFLASLTHDSIEFESSEYGKKTFEIINDSKTLGFRFNFDSIANFWFRPSFGVIMPEKRAKITVRFEPHQIGNFNHLIHCKIGNIEKRNIQFIDQVLLQVPLRLVGKYQAWDSIQPRPKTCDTTKSQMGAW